MTKQREDQSCALRVGPSVVDLNKEDVQRLYFRTTTGQTFNRTDAPAEARSENFVEVHLIGQRRSKYMGYPQNRAPLLDRSSLEYNRDFVVWPLDDVVTTREMAQVNKDRTLDGPSGSHAKFDGSTKYNADFKAPSRREAAGARQKSAKPKAGRTHTLPTGDLIEKRSFSHAVFVSPSRKFRSEKATPPRSNLFLAERNFPPSTAYREQFTHPTSPAASPKSRPSTACSKPAARPSSGTDRKKLRQRCQSAPAGGRAQRDRERQQDDSSPRSSLGTVSAVRPHSAVAKLQAMICRDPDIHKIRRACYLTPGR